MASKNQKTNDVAAKWAQEAGAQEVTGGGFWKPEKVGEAIRGVLLRIRRNQGKYKQSVADIRTDGAVIMSVGLSAVLQARITDDMCGKEVGISYAGTEVSPNDPDTEYKMFRVFVFGDPKMDDDLPF